MEISAFSHRVNGALVSMLANDDLNSAATAALCCSSKSDMDVAVKLTLASLLALSEDISDSTESVAFFFDLGIVPHAVLVLLAKQAQIIDQNRV